MTEKQENILNAALELFAKEGFKATSTNKVARKAGVSEGLVFKHFENKAGLLEAILKEGEKKFKMLYADVVMENDPKERLKKLISLPFNISEDEYGFWKLQYKLKWELGYDSSDKMKPLVDSIAQAFKQLGYKDAYLETELLLQTFNGVSTAIINNQMTDSIKIKELILKKYSI